MGRENFTKAMQFRHACKVFNGEKIPKEDLAFILDAGRLSPSSFGVEQWRFIVVQSPELKEKLRVGSYDQEQLTTCSDAVVIIGLTEELKPGSAYLDRMFRRWDLPDDKLAGVRAFYKTMVDTYDIKWWSIAQCHLAAANMMTAAAMIGIDSCPIGGFDEAKVAEALALDMARQIPALIVPFGYRVNPQRGKLRLSMDELVEYR